MNRRKFIKKSVFGIAGFTFLINTISCNEDDIIMKIDDKIQLPDILYIVTHISKKIYTKSNYTLNDENKVELFISGVILLKNNRLLKKIKNKNFPFEEINNTHYKIYFDRIVNLSVTKNLFKNETIHYIIEDNLMNKSTSISLNDSPNVNSFSN